MSTNTEGLDDEYFTDDDEEYTSSQSSESDESQTEEINADNYNEVIASIKERVIDRISRIHSNEQSKLYEKYIQATNLFSNEKELLLDDMQLYDLGILQKDKVFQTLKCFSSSIKDLNQMFEDKATF
ncbi:hypothetical protein EIN_496570 [Entamoeba invadens IP1]|uniref:Uncharacterized protein n=1 Tax=Entamoeba invadens IP1 TaxID=370355 RepID=A0A0A1TZS0_ENTIV|nr:hypothetical protein EIN_496570 [Entamoeba invadens IP1]ELP87122.1 hypothetical protein EIN_496570 [Entamoeba invadens IP1]|eukprot:XP_004253893.1 hypothetical protein EIN_496570 [Entamoeba invadens IP1]